MKKFYISGPGVMYKPSKELYSSKKGKKLIKALKKLQKTLERNKQ